MSFTDNLIAFNTNIENAIAAIPQEEIANNPNIYRLVKLLSWSKQASGSVGGGSGGGGSTSPTDIASGINAATDIDSIITELEAISTGVNGATSLKDLLVDLEDTLTNIDNQTQSILDQNNRLYKGPNRRDFIFDIAINNNDSDQILPANTNPTWITAFTISVNEPCLLKITDSVDVFYQVLNQQGIEKVYKYPRNITSLPISFEVSEASNPVRFVGSFELEESI